jgi:catechol 2,3-dioxygenase
METIFNPHRLGHVNLVVHELERSTRFYQSVCGLALEFSEVGLRGNFLGSGRTHHDVGMIERTTEDRYGKDGHLQIPKSAADQVRLNHVAWEMDTEKDLVQAIGRARAHGVPLLRVSDHQITHSVYLKDPDGNVVEFYSDVIRDWRTVLHGEVDHITSVWTPDEASASVERMWDPAPIPRHVEGACFHPARLSHVVLKTNRLDEMTDFYQRVGGLRLVHSGAGVRFFDCREEGQGHQLAIVQDDTPGLHHFAFELADAAGLAPAESGGWQVPVQRVDGPLKQSAYVRDPDGFLVEFFARRGTDYAAVDRFEAAERALQV